MIAWLIIASAKHNHTQYREIIHILTNLEMELNRQSDLRNQANLNLYDVGCLPFDSLEGYLTIGDHRIHRIHQFPHKVKHFEGICGGPTQHLHCCTI